MGPGRDGGVGVGRGGSFQVGQKRYEKNKLELQLKFKPDQQLGQMRLEEPKGSAGLRCWPKI